MAMMKVVNGEFIEMTPQEEQEFAALQAAIQAEMPTPRPQVSKSTVQARIIGAGKMSDAYAMLTANPVAFAQWFAPDWPNIYCDDPDAAAFVTALGLDPAVILAPA